MQGFWAHLQGLAGTVYSTRLKSQPVITLPSFRLHYPLNVVILCLLTLFATYQIAGSGSAIQCTVDPSIVDAGLMNTYCWIQSTYTLPHLAGGIVGQSVISPGVGSMRGDNDPVTYHKYYQWVVFFLLFQALLSYLPYYFWNSFENGRIEMLLVANEKVKVGDVELSPITSFLSKNLANNNTYFRVYIAAEVLNLLNIILQLVLLDVFLGHEFTTYGLKVLEFIDEDSGRTDPMDLIFPKVTKCTFRKYGPTGNIVNYDGLCVLALNIFHEKIFIFLWFWFIILTFFTILGIIWNIVALFSHSFRTHLLQKNVLNFSRHPEQTNDPKFDTVTRLPSHNNPKFEAIETIMNRLEPGDWFVLYQLSRNMWPHHFKQLVRELALEFGWKEPKQE